MDILNFLRNVVYNITNFFINNGIVANIVIFTGIALFVVAVVLGAKNSSKKRENEQLKHEMQQLERKMLAEKKEKAIKEEKVIREDKSFDFNKENEVIVYKESKIADIIKIAENLKNNGNYAVAARMLENYSTDTDDILIKKQCDMLAVECLIYNESYTAACEKAMSMLEAQYNLTKSERRRIMAMVRAMLEL